MLGLAPSSVWEGLCYVKTPTLCGGVIAFEGFLKSLKDLQIALHGEGIEVEDIIDKGLAKLDEYYLLSTKVPAYHFALSEWLYYLYAEETLI